ncbi:hypothetical protein BJX76DRAFT_321189 [Aspergillus varians]
MVILLRMISVRVKQGHNSHTNRKTQESEPRDFELRGGSHSLISSDESYNLPRPARLQEPLNTNRVLVILQANPSILEYLGKRLTSRARNNSHTQWDTLMRLGIRAKTRGGCGTVRVKITRMKMAPEGFSISPTSNARLIMLGPKDMDAFVGAVPCSREKHGDLKRLTSIRSRRILPKGRRYHPSCHCYPRLCCCRTTPHSATYQATTDYNNNTLSTPQ